MGLVVNPNDIAANQKTVEKMQKMHAEAVKMRTDVLKDFDAKMRNLDSKMKIMEEAIKDGQTRVRYHKVLKFEVEQRIAGKRMAMYEHQDDVRVKEFIDVVAKKDLPDFEKAADQFEDALEDIQQALA